MNIKVNKATKTLNKVKPYSHDHGGHPSTVGLFPYIYFSCHPQVLGKSSPLPKLCKEQAGLFLNKTLPSVQLHFYYCARWELLCYYVKVRQYRLKQLRSVSRAHVLLNIPGCHSNTPPLRVSDVLVLHSNKDCLC